MHMRRDLVFALRQLRKNRGFALAATMTVALGIGANTAIFTVVRTVLLTPLPFSDPGRLTHVAAVGLKSGRARDWVSFRDAVDWRARNRSFSTMGSYAFGILNLVGSDQPEALYGATISSDLFPTLGVEPALGRNFLPEEDWPGREHVVILSHQLWRTRFGGDTHIVGRHLHLVNVGKPGEDYVVVGVMPAGFNFPMNVPSAVSLPSRQMAFWIPFGLDPSKVSRDGRTCMVVARLGGRGTLQLAQQDMDRVSAELAREYPDSNADRGARISSFEDHVLGRTRPALVLLLASTALLLLIACANIANLLLARAMSRTREMAVRVALGASRGRIVRQWLTESLLIAAAGGSAGYLAAVGGTALLLKLAPEDTPRLGETHLDAAVFFFNVAASILAGLLFGGLPAWRAASVDVAEQINSGGTRMTDRGRARSWVIVAEVALSMMLVSAAGLMARSVARLLTQDSGFQTDHVLTAIMVLPQSRYPDAASKTEFYRKVLDRVKAIPGVQSTGAVNGVPLSGNISSRPVRIEGRPAPGRGENRLWSEVFSASEDYLATMGVALLRGRLLTRHDGESADSTVVINQAAARQFWPDANAIGKRLGMEGVDAGGQWREVVGIVKDTADLGLDDAAKPAIYVPMEQPVEAPQFLAVRTAGPPAGFATALRQAVAEVDREQPILVATPMRQLVETSIGARRFAMQVLMAFGVLSLVLAAIGLYGVVAYSVASRTQEIGVRVALGATRSGIFGLVLSESMGLTAAGLVAGAAGSFVSARWLASLLYGVTAHDPATLMAACGLLAAVALAASCVPARQAMRVEPMVALRQG